MNKIKEFIKKVEEFLKKIYRKIGNDGVLHFLVCFAIVAMLCNFLNPALSFFIAIFIGFAKEIIWDGALGKGQFQWKDIWCDIAGALIAALPPFIQSLI